MWTVFLKILKSPRYILYGVVVVITTGGLLFFTGMGANLNIGGILKLLRRWFKVGKDSDVIVKANTIHKKRVDKDGNIISIGKQDVRGFKQVKVDTLKLSKNPLRDKTVIKLGDGEEVPLPTGIKDTDVKEVIVLKPTVYAVLTKDNTLKKVIVKKLLDTMPE